MGLPVTFELSGNDLRKLSGKLDDLANRIDDLDNRTVPLEAYIRFPIHEGDDSRLEIEVGIDRLGVHWTCKF